jgi:5-formyltetrahydrofolate cyclo-ligase
MGLSRRSGGDGAAGPPEHHVVTVMVENRRPIENRREHMDEVRGADAKKRLREIMLSRRDGLSIEERDLKSSAIAASVIGMPEFQRAGTVMVYASFRSEVDTGPLISWCRQRGKRVVFPKVTGAGTMEVFLVADPRLDLEPGVWGIPEPKEGLERVDPSEIDVVIVPGAAFDLHGGRLGYGGGFYDAYLPGVRADTSLVGVAFGAQVVESVPTGGHDVRMDVLVTETDLTRFVGRGN